MLFFVVSNGMTGVVPDVRLYLLGSFENCGDVAREVMMHVKGGLIKVDAVPSSQILSQGSS